MRILCTGGGGYIGSHTVIALTEAGFECEILDNFSNASKSILPRLEKILGKSVATHGFNCGDKEALRNLFRLKKYDGVIHFAALKSVGESVSLPLEYYANNVIATVTLLEVMKEVDCKILVFSSSATVYRPKDTPVVETDLLGASNPYGHSKVFCEQIIQDLCASDKTWKVSLLRYFNPVGAHPSGTIGEAPQGIPNNLTPYIQQVAIGKLEQLSVFGNDWPTADGTGVRDYIHVQDLADGHVAALKTLQSMKEGACLVHNLGTGKGFSVLEMVELFRKASGHPIPYRIVARRAGDLACVVANCEKANKDLDWHAKRTIGEAINDSWKWQSQNPNGFD